MRFVSSVSALVAVLTLSAWAAPAVAEVSADDLGFDLISAAEFKRSKPMIVLSPSISLSSVQFDLQRADGKRLRLKSGAVREGTTRKIPIDQGKGIFSYKCSITGKAGRERFGPFELTFEIKVGEPPRIAIGPTDVNEAARTITVRVTEPAGKIDLRVLGDDGEVIDEVSQPYEQKPGTPITVPWKQEKGEVMGRFELKAWDVVGFYSGIESVTFMNIPHEDVVFESGKHDILPAEERKLVEPLARIQAELAKVRGILPITLYVGGYTDTVGSAADNMALSQRRARAIAAWFRAKGVRVPVLFQGFGESVLFAQTPDNTDEPRNRRAAYVLSTQPPPVSRGFPAGRWQGVK